MSLERLAYVNTKEQHAGISIKVLPEQASDTITGSNLWGESMPLSLKDVPSSKPDEGMSRSAYWQVCKLTSLCFINLITLSVHYSNWF